MSLRSPCAIVTLLASTVFAASATAQSAPPVAAEDDADARTLFTLGQGAYDRGRYREALDYFQRAYALSHRPELLYNIGQTADRLRQDRLALESFERYLQEVPNGPNRAATESRVAILREALAAQATQPAQPAQSAQAPQPVGAPPSTTDAAPTPSATAAAVPATPDRPTPSTGDADDGPSMTGIGLLAGGGVGIAFGATFLALGLKDIAAVEDAPDGSSFSSVSSAYDRAPTRTTVGFVMLGVGVGAGVAGLAVMLAGGDDHEVALRLRVAPTGVALEGRF